MTELRVRWLGHKLYAEVSIAVDPLLSVKEEHAIDLKVRHRMMHSLDYLSNVVVHVDLLGSAGKHFTGSPNMRETICPSRLGNF